MQLPPDHALRFELNNEVHARPPEPVKAPARASFVALSLDGGTPELHVDAIKDLCSRCGVDNAVPAGSHFSHDFGGFRLKWEAHSEFVRYLVIVAGVPDDPFAEPAFQALPEDWFGRLSGSVLMAGHAVLLPRGRTVPGDDEISKRWFNGNPIVGAQVAGDSALAFTDFQIQPDGWSRHILFNKDLTDRQAGRVVQRLFEIDAYRMLALLTLPVAQESMRLLREREFELAEITEVMTRADESDDQVLLDRLSALEASIENRYSMTQYRFSAGAAYYELVQRRIAELREKRLRGLQTFQEFIERRMAPAMNTCEVAARRQDALSERVSRAAQLLSTRVEFATEKQNQSLLESMDRRAKLQLRLQETVEGLSIAAITYYLVQLVGNATNGLVGAGIVDVDASVIQAISIPIVAILIAVGVRRIRRLVAAGDGAS